MLKKKKTRSKQQEDPGGVMGQTTSEVSLHAEAAVGPDARIDVGTSDRWLARHSNNAPDIGKERPKKETYAASNAALIDKYILSKASIPFPIVILSIGSIFFQDNGTGQLTDWKALLWTVEKCSVLFVLYLAVIGLQWIYNKITMT